MDREEYQRLMLIFGCYQRRIGLEGQDRSFTFVLLYFQWRYLTIPRSATGHSLSVNHWPPHLSPAAPKATSALQFSAFSLLWFNRLTAWWAPSFSFLWALSWSILVYGFLIQPLGRITKASSYQSWSEPFFQWCFPIALFEPFVQLVRLHRSWF